MPTLIARGATASHVLAWDAWETWLVRATAAGWQPGPTRLLWLDRGRNRRVPVADDAWGWFVSGGYLQPGRMIEPSDAAALAVVLAGLGDAPSGLVEVLRAGGDAAGVEVS